MLPCYLPYELTTETRFSGGLCHLRSQLPSAQTLPCPLTLPQESSAALIRDLCSTVLPWMVLHHPLPGSSTFTPPRTFTSGSFQLASEYRRLLFHSQTTAHIIPAPPCSLPCILGALKLQSCPLTPPLYPAPFKAPQASPLSLFNADSGAGLPGFESQVFHRQALTLGSLHKLSEPHSHIKMGIKIIPT